MARFLTGTRFASGNIVVEPQDYILAPTGRRMGKTKVMRVEVNDHVIDTEVDARRHKWTEEEHQQVIDHLNELVASGEGRAKGRGITEEKGTIPTKLASQVVTCAATWAEPDGSVGRCPEPVLEGLGWCATHVPVEVAS